MVSYIMEKYEVAYKEKLKEHKMKRNPTWYVILAIGLVIIYSSLAAFSIIKKINWGFPVFSISFLIIVMLLRFFKDKKLENITDTKDKAEILYNTLIIEKITKGKQIEVFMEMVKNKLTSSRISKDLFKPFSVFFSSVILTLLTLIIGWILNKTEPSLDVLSILAMIVAVLLQLFGLFLIVKPAVEEVLDREYFKLQEFQVILENTYLIYFCDERNDIK